MTFQGLKSNHLINRRLFLIYFFLIKSVFTNYFIINMQIFLPKFFTFYKNSTTFKCFLVICMVLRIFKTQIQKMFVSQSHIYFVNFHIFRFLVFIKYICSVVLCSDQLDIRLISRIFVCVLTKLNLPIQTFSIKTFVLANNK